MVFRWLVNAGLLAIPIGTTVGILVGIDLHRHAAGQAPLFNVVPGSGTGGNIDDSGGGIKDNGFTETQYCQKDRAISPSSKGVQYTCTLLCVAFLDYELYFPLFQTNTSCSESQSMGMECGRPRLVVYERMCTATAVPFLWCKIKY